MNIKLGIIREGKVPPDKRVPFTPLQAEEIEQRYPHVKVIVQPSKVRCFSDDEYTQLGLEVREDLQDCDILMGVKEVQKTDLMSNKIYLFFSHTIKKQPYNKKLLQEVLRKKIQLIDYETLKDKFGNRMVAFGRFAGIVGAYNGLMAYGMRYKTFSIRRAHACFDINDLKIELRKVQLPPLKIVLTGAGRVGKGAMETLDTAGIRKVSVDDFLSKDFEVPVYVQLSSADYHQRKEGGHFNRDEFHQHPERYASTFKRFSSVTDILLAGAYWNPKAPVLFTMEDMRQPDFKIKIIADITCDINGSIPSTIRASTIDDPLYDFDPFSEKDKQALSGDKHTTVMAVDNLPCELPRSASEEFGRDLIDKILPALIIKDVHGVIKRAKITKGGQLMENFSYLTDYVSFS